MARNLKAEILENEFVNKLRMELSVDEKDYAKLVSSLKALAPEWQKVSVIDKELMQDLYVLATICRNMAPNIPEQSEQIEEMATEIDALVLECLA